MDIRKDIGKKVERLYRKDGLGVQPMNVDIKRIDSSLPLPRYETKGSVGFDLLTRVDAYIDPHAIKLIPANVIVHVPLGYYLMVALRSSTPRKFGLMMPQGIGIVDNDFCGPEDELMIQVLNFTKDPVYVARGSRIAQCVFVCADTCHWNEVQEMKEPNRGGFGSTG